MGFFYDDIKINVIFKDEIINEEFFKGKVAKLNIAIRVRDFREGRAGQITRHKDSPSIKVINYGKGKSNYHSSQGDPVYFYIENNQIQLSYDKNKFGNEEIVYITNFIKHNYINLSNYWFAPKNIKDPVKVEILQDKIKYRILYNINTCNYRRDQGVDNEVKI